MSKQHNGIKLGNLNESILLFMLLLLGCFLCLSSGNFLCLSVHLEEVVGYF